MVKKIRMFRMWSINKTYKLRLVTIKQLKMELGRFMKEIGMLTIKLISSSK